MITWYSTIWEYTKHRVVVCCALLPAEDLGERQNLSVTVPHRHSWSFAAAQTTQEGGRCLLLVCHFPSRASLCQVLLRPAPAYSLGVASLFIHPTTRPSDLFIPFLLFGERETDGLHAVDLHKRQVKLRKARERDRVKQRLNLLVQLCFNVKLPAPGPPCSCACRGTWGIPVGECPTPGWGPLFRPPGVQRERGPEGSWDTNWTYKWETHTWTCPPHSPTHLERQRKRDMMLHSKKSLLYINDDSLHILAHHAYYTGFLIVFFTFQATVTSQKGRFKYVHDLC